MKWLNDFIYKFNHRYDKPLSQTERHLWDTVALVITVFPVFVVLFVLGFYFIYMSFTIIPRRLTGWPPALPDPLPEKYGQSP
jgi:hypothetical protein